MSNAFDRNRPDASSASLASGLNIIAGLWLIISPFVLSAGNLPGLRTNNIIVGIIVVILSAVRVGSPLTSGGLSWVNVILGIWMIISPWVVGFSMVPGLIWHNVILGIIVGLLALWSAMSASPNMRTRTM